MSVISDVRARELLDSRGNPTIEVDVRTSDGSFGRASVPSGASTGSKEAIELRDGDLTRFGGLGVLNAIENIRKIIAPGILGRSVLDQASLDDTLIGLDGTLDKSRMGANALVGVSLAIARAAASSLDIPLYRYFGETDQISLPVPMFNVLNGGRHAENSTDIQEFMVVPAGFETFSRSVQAGSEVFNTLRRLLSEKGFGTAVGDEGGFAPEVSSNRQAIELVLQAIEMTGYTPGRHCFIALDVAASELLGPEGKYLFNKEGNVRSSIELVDEYQQLVEEYPIISIEDGLAENDWSGWRKLTQRIGDKIQVVGDDVFVTNTDILGKGIQDGVCNSILIKVNQIGTLTETLNAIEMAKKAGYTVVISHRSGETEDTTISDIAVAVNAGQIKTGSLCRTDRVAKYNQLLRIEEMLGEIAVFSGRGVFYNICC